MRTSVKIVHWLPRIICILAILFISMFAMDSFSNERTFWHNIAALLIHLIPSFILIVMLIVSWIWELPGGIFFILVGLVAGPFIYFHNYNMNHSVSTSLFIVLMVAFPFVLTGVLFIMSYFMKKRTFFKQ